MEIEANAWEKNSTVAAKAMRNGAVQTTGGQANGNFSASSFPRRLAIASTKRAIQNQISNPTPIAKSEQPTIPRSANSVQ